jgi:hypothetical protein
MQNLVSLKLNKLILYNEINSEQRIFSNVKLIALHHAKRYYVYANFLSENHYKISIQNIQELNSKILYRIENLIKWGLYNNL